MKTALALGGGIDQIRLIQDFKRRGYHVVVIDHDINAPGNKFADEYYAISTMNQKQVSEIAKKKQVSLLGAISTDQPLLTATLICEEMGLYYPISHKQAIQVTNKKIMKQKLVKYGVPTAKHEVFRSLEEYETVIKKLSFPLVIKPVDSSAARGVQKINNNTPEVNNIIKRVLMQSRSNTCIVEEYYHGQEISVDAIVIDGKAYVIMITDNFTVEQEEKIGLITKSIYPSVISKKAKERIVEIVSDIARVFNFRNTLLFVQMMVKDDSDVKVIECSARNAGGSKHHLISMVTGIDVINLYTRILHREDINIKFSGKYNYVEANYIYSHPGRVCSIVNVEHLCNNGMIALFEMYKPLNYVSRGMYDASDRIGVFIVKGNSFEDLMNKTLTVEKRLSIKNDEYKDILIHGLYY